MIVIPARIAVYRTEIDRSDNCDLSPKRGQYEIWRFDMTDRRRDVDN